MKVSVIRDHINTYGNHKVGDTYSHPRPATDIDFGYIKKWKPEPKPEKKAKSEV